MRHSLQSPSVDPISIGGAFPIRRRSCENCGTYAGTFGDYEWRLIKYLQCDKCRKQNFLPRIQERDREAMTEADYLWKHHGLTVEEAALWCLTHYMELRQDGSTCPECQEDAEQERRDKHRDSSGYGVNRKMSRHIPGPWEVKETTHKNVGCFHIEHGGEEIASTPLTYTNMECAHEEEIEKANAHLIAAAPDMYEALKAIQSRIVSTEVDIVDEMVIHNIAMKALAKVEGKDE